MSDPDAAVVASLGLGERRTRRWPWVVGGGVVLAALVALAVVLLRPPPEGRWVWETAPVAHGDLVVMVTAIGSLEPLNAVDIGSEASGTVAAVHVEANDVVVAGQLLAELDTSMPLAQLRQARAQLAGAEAGLTQARVAARQSRSELRRSEILHRGGAISDSVIESARSSAENAEAAVAVAVAQVSQARASRDAAETTLDHTEIRTPISGVVLERHLEPGQSVVSSLQATTAFVVAEDLQRMSVDVDVDEADVGRVAAGQQATFTVAAFGDRVFDAVVRKVDLAPKPNAQVVTYVATLELDNADSELRPGMTATVEIAAESFTDRLLVPTAALRYTPPDVDLAPPAPREGKRVARVWRLDDTVPVPIDVVTSASDGRRAVLVEGELADGDLLVIGAEPRRRAPFRNDP
ncbi:MAG: HlyD family secretion protein [Myxococcota bacterium]|jgi:HlyD family secretion protein